jgi:hypothetical protein
MIFSGNFYAIYVRYLIKYEFSLIYFEFVLTRWILAPKRSGGPRHGTRATRFEVSPPGADRR